MDEKPASGEVPDDFLREPVEAYVRPVLQDLAQQASGATASIPPALIHALAPRYTITRELGQGGMASVYLAFDQSLSRHVAVKVLQPQIADALTAERFLREIDRKSTRLNSSHYALSRMPSSA